MSIKTTTAPESSFTVAQPPNVAVRVFQRIGPYIFLAPAIILVCIFLLVSLLYLTRTMRSS